MVKVTFTLDQATIERLNDAAARRRIPKSQVVREAIEDYSGNAGRMSDAEREEKLRAVREMMATLPSRPQKEVEAEIAEIRRARRHGGRLHRAE